MRKKNFILLVCILLAVGCGGKDTSRYKVFRYNESSGITSLDPLKATNLSNIWAIQQIYEGLTCIDSAGKVQPLLASSWTADTSYTRFVFYLRTPVFFHPSPAFGKSERLFTSADVDFTCNRVYKNPSTSWAFQNVEYDSLTARLHIETPNDTTVIFFLKQSMAHFPQMLALPFCGMMAEETVHYFGTDLRRNPAGTGPFYLKAWHENEKMILSRNEKYHVHGLPLLDGISISFLKDKQTALLEFIRGHFDFISGLDAAYKDELLTNDGKLHPRYTKDIYISRQPYLNTEYLGILMKEDDTHPLSNLHIRKALNYGVNREKLIKFIRNGMGTAGTCGMVPPSLYTGVQPPQGYTYNPDFFYDEIKQAGFSSPAQVPVITLYTDVAYTDVCTFLVHEWNDLGLKVNLEVLDRPTLKSQVAKGGCLFFRGSWIADYPDPENYLSLFYGPYASPAGSNYTHFSSPEFDALYDARLHTRQADEVNRIYARLDSLVLTQSPVIILYYDEVIRFISKRVTGIPAHPMNYLDLRKTNLQVIPAP